jgi:hypothetical protein
MRDIDANPYDPSEARVAREFAERFNVGGGDDPVGALLGMHNYAVHQRNAAREALRAARVELLRLGADAAVVAAVDEALAL